MNTTKENTLKPAGRLLAEAARQSQENTEVATRAHEALLEAEMKAIDNLARYKFHNFGYWAACWVHARNTLHGKGSHKLASPFSLLVKFARAMKAAQKPARRTGLDSVVDRLVFDHGTEAVMEALARVVEENK